MNRLKRLWRLRKINKADTQTRAQAEIKALRADSIKKIPHQPN